MIVNDWKFLFFFFLHLLWTCDIILLVVRLEHSLMQLMEISILAQKSM